MLFVRVQKVTEYKNIRQEPIGLIVHVSLPKERECFYMDAFPNQEPWTTKKQRWQKTRQRLERLSQRRPNELRRLGHSSTFLLFPSSPRLREVERTLGKDNASFEPRFSNEPRRLSLR